MTQRDEIEQILRYYFYTGEPGQHGDIKSATLALTAALRRIRSLEEKNVAKYARSIATEALERTDTVSGASEWKENG